MVANWILKDCIYKFRKKKKKKSFSRVHVILKSKFKLAIIVFFKIPLQVFNKLLSLANSAAQPKADFSLWTNLLLSTSGVRHCVFEILLLAF